MKIHDKKTKELLYDSEGDMVYMVDRKFWDAVKKVGIPIRTGGEMPDGTMYTEVGYVKVGSPEFEETFEGMWNSTIGRDRITGRIPLE